MRRWFMTVLTVAPMLAALSFAPIGASAADGWQAVDAWVTVGSDHPGAGCVVEASVEVRGEAGPATNLDIALGLVVDGEMVDVARGVTGDDGVAYLGVDTSSTYAGAATRLEINLAGTYADRMDLTPTEDGPCEGQSTMLTTEAEIWISAAAPAAVAPAAAEAADEMDEDAVEGTGAGTFLEVPTYVQQRNLSCEYAALSIATGGLGAWVSEYEFDERVGWSANPHFGFRGDINGLWGNTTDYGVYPEALVGPLAQLGFSGEVIYGAGDASALTAHLDAGMPTLLWLGLWGDTSYYEAGEDGSSYKLASGYHVVVAYGYDEWGVYVSDPAIGGYRSFDWATFMTMWNVLDGMALAVAAV